MKTIVPLLILATIVSCNDTSRTRSTITNNDKVISQYSSALVAQRGTVATLKNQGSEFAVNLTKTNGLLETTPVSTRTTSVIINIDGNKIYKHLTIQDLITKQTTKKVVMDNENVQQELKEILDSGKGRVIGDNLSLKYSEEMPASEDDEFEMMTKFTFEATVNLWRPHCDSKSQISATGTMMINGNVDSTKSYVTKETSTCEKTYTDKQLKAIDLSSIEFCSYPNGEDEQCEADRDMSFLTSDL